MEGKAETCGCKKRPTGKGIGVPGGMIKVSDFVVVRVPFERRVVPLTVIEAGALKQVERVQYLYGGSWVDAKTLLAMWQPWKSVDVSALASRADNVPASVARRG